MSKKGLKFGIASAAVIGAGAAVLRAKNKSEAKKAAETTTVTSEPKNDYRNTERGKDKKNSKGIYYTNGNYEAFARPEKPEGVDEKSAYLVGSGLAALAAACFLVRDGQMKGDHIHILEAMDIAGGACDGIYDPTRGYIMRGGREMENHFECLWDLFHSIRLDVRRIEALKQGGEMVGNRTRIKVVKNKVAPPFREAEFDIMFGKGISKEGDVLDLAASVGIVQKSGAWFAYGGDKIGQGRENAKAYLREHPEIMDEIEHKVRVAYGLIKEEAPEGTEETAAVPETEGDDE